MSLELCWDRNSMGCIQSHNMAGEWSLFCQARPAGAIKMTKNNIQDVPQKCIQAELIVNEQRNTPVSIASIHLWHCPRLSHTSSVLLFFLSLSSEAVTDHHWDINQRKSSVNGRKLQGNSVHGGLCHVTQQQTRLLLVCVCARALVCVRACVCICVCVCVCEEKRDTGSALQIIQHQSCQVASTISTSSRAKTMKQQHNLQPRDDIY